MSKTPYREASQHNLLVRAPFKMTVLEARVFTHLLSYIHKSDREFSEIRVPVRDILGESCSGRHYMLLREACDKLHRQRLDLLPPGSKKHHLDKVNFFDRVRVGDGMVQAWFSQSIKPYLLNLTREFATAEIEKLLTLHNPYAHRMYWFLRSIRNMGEVVSSVDELRGMLVPDKGKYKTFGEFNKHVLQPALEEVRGLGDEKLVFEATPVKESRSVVAIRFTFTGEAQGQAAGSTPAKSVYQPVWEAYSALDTDTQASFQRACTDEQRAYIVMMKAGLDTQQADYFVARVPPLDITKTVSEVRLNHTLDRSAKVGHLYNRLKAKCEA